MAVEARLTEQMPFVTTPEQAAVIQSVAKARRMSKAAVLRACVDKVFDMDNAEPKRGQTTDDIVSTGTNELGWS